MIDVGPNTSATSGMIALTDSLSANHIDISNLQLPKGWVASGGLPVAGTANSPVATYDIAANTPTGNEAVMLPQLE